METLLSKCHTLLILLYLRYLKIGFERALRASKADVVVFLGDLMNEGIQMSKAEFNLSLTRFESIFHMPTSTQVRRRFCFCRSLVCWFLGCTCFLKCYFYRSSRLVIITRQ